MFFFKKKIEGVLSAMKEIEWVKAVQPTAPQLKYYYMGFYIHDCTKMKYKVTDKTFFVFPFLLKKN